jgi:phospholipid/cholesterol/gamma-HCH transport system substrate-binding protein
VTKWSGGNSSGEIEAWAAHLATITDQLRTRDTSVAGVLENGSATGEEARQLFERLQPTLPIVLANLVGLGQVAVTYQNDLEQLLVLIPQGISAASAGLAPNHDSKHTGFFPDFNLNINLPPVCSTGFLPPQQIRSPAFEDYPNRPEGDLYCRVRQDSPFNVRGARNIPCETVPGKSAPP